MESSHQLYLYIDEETNEENLITIGWLYYDDKLYKFPVLASTVNKFKIKYNDNFLDSQKDLTICPAEHSAPLGTSLIEFINWDFNNFYDFSFFVTKHYFYFVLKGETPDEQNEIITNSRDYLIKIYTKEKENLIKLQNNMKQWIDTIFNINNKKDLRELTPKQRFFFLKSTLNSFSEFKPNYKNDESLEFYYSDNIVSDYMTSGNFIKQIKNYDPDGTKILAPLSYSSNDFFSLLYLTLFYLLKLTDCNIRKCKNCGKYFITNKSNTLYCDNIFKNNQTCKEIGNQIALKKKQETDDVYALYRRIYAQKGMLVNRNKDIPYYKETFENWKKEAQEYRKGIKNGTNTADEFKKWLEENK